MQILRAASRRSQLAMTQTQWVINQLMSTHQGLGVDVVPIVTKGDRILDVALSKVGGKGLFVSEIEETLLAGEADFAVHSLKDVPGLLAPHLGLVAMPLREDPRDALVSRSGAGFLALPQGAKIGTSSLRRITQLKAQRPDLEFVPIRGNIDTRLKKLESEGLDAIVLAAAGLKRMGWADRITELLAPEVCLPAIGQGILGIEARVDDREVLALLAVLHDSVTSMAATAERALLTRLDGGCQVPMAGYAEVLADETIRMRAMVADPNGTERLFAESTDRDAVALGTRLAEQLLEQGASRILESTATTG